MYIVVVLVGGDAVGRNARLYPHHHARGVRPEAIFRRPVALDQLPIKVVRVLLALVGAAEVTTIVPRDARDLDRKRMKKVKKKKKNMGQ